VASSATFSATNANARRISPPALFGVGELELVLPREVGRPVQEACVGRAWPGQEQVPGRRVVGNDTGVPGNIRPFHDASDNYIYVQSNV